MQTIQRTRSYDMRAKLVTRLGRGLVDTLVKTRIFTVTIHNRQVVPMAGPVIFACNHISLADPVILWNAIRRDTSALAMAELWKHPASRWLMDTLGHIPVDRGNHASGDKALKQAQAVLEREGAVIIFPEGRCGEGNELQPFKRGIETLALASYEKDPRTTIVPVGISGTNQVLPLKSRKLNRRAHVHLRFGTPIDVEQYFDDNGERSLLRDLATEIAELAYPTPMGSNRNAHPYFERNLSRDQSMAPHAMA